MADDANLVPGRVQIRRIANEARPSLPWRARVIACSNQRPHRRPAPVARIPVSASGGASAATFDVQRSRTDDLDRVALLSRNEPRGRPGAASPPPGRGQQGTGA